MTGSTSRLLGALLLTSSILASAGTAVAQDEAIGKEEYRMHCAACHGLDGRGDGPIGQILKTPAPNLAMITERNGGKFPVQKIYDIIEGSSVIAAHGTRDMPLWGDRYREAPQPVTPDQAIMSDDQAQQRILSLVYYLGTMQ
ncbi:MAG: cytochrome c [Aestuariivirga sp.]|nr:cytochrome c [Aestuariivirga sp.]